MASTLDEVIGKVASSASRYYAHSGAVRSSDPLGLDILSSLRRLKRELEVLMQDRSIKLVVSISKGQSNIPRILYVAISRVAERLSTEPSVCICFDEKGTGLVLGMMYPMSYLKTTKFPKVKRDQGEMVVDLSSKRSKSNFNNLFVNPKEFLVHDLATDLFLKHLWESIDFLKSEIGYVN